MNLTSPKHLAALLAVILTSLVFLVFIGLEKFHLNFLVEFILFVIGSLISFYFIINLFVSKFLNDKIKLIYKLIDTTKDAPVNRVIPEGSDIFKEVNLDVEDWVLENEAHRDDMERREEFRREYIGNVSHELKTPIFNIQGYILTLLEGGLEDESVNRKYLERAEKSVSRMINLVNDLDTITRLEGGQLKLEISKVDICSLAEDVIESLEDYSKEKGIVIKFNRDYNLPIYVKCDKQRIFQALTNLIVNSIKYGKFNKGTTEIGFYPMEDNILVEISDNGVGMEEKHLSRLFERFYRVEESRSRDKGGSGLGLAIVKHIVEAHNQSINVKSTKDLGSTFSFTLKKA